MFRTEVNCATGEITQIPLTEEEIAAAQAAQAAEQEAARSPERIIAAVQSILDEQAKAWGYDDLRAAVSYIGDPFPRFNAEGTALRDWRSAVWVYVASSAALDPQPTPQEFFANLPAAPERPQ